MGCTMSSQGTVPLPLFGCMERAKVLQLWSSLPRKLRRVLNCEIIGIGLLFAGRRAVRRHT